MPWIIIGSLASSVVSFIVSNLTTKPAITIEQPRVELNYVFKLGFYVLTGLIAVKILRGLK